MKCESAHKIVQVWRKFDRNTVIQYCIDEKKPSVVLRIRYLNDQFLYVCENKSASIIYNGDFFYTGSTYAVLKRTEALLPNTEKIGFCNAIAAVPMQKPKPQPIRPIKKREPKKKPSRSRTAQSTIVPIDKRPICMNCAYFSHCATTSSKRVGCNSFVLK